MLMLGTTDYLVKTLNCQAENTSLWVLVQGESKKPQNTLGFLSDMRPYCWRHCTLLVTVLKETILSLAQKFPPRELSFIVSEGSVHSTKGEKKLQQWWDWQAVPNSAIIVFASCRQPIVVKLNLKSAQLVRTHAWYCKPSQEPIARGAIGHRENLLHHITNCHLDIYNYTQR